MNRKDQLKLGLIALALFVGAGNIIFPPFIGLRSGENLHSAILGFLITGVGLPILALVAMARNEGSLERLTQPVGKVFGLALAFTCYISLGPLFGTPRTATVSYEIGVQPLLGNSLPLWLFSLVFFSIVTLCSLNTRKLIAIVGNYLSPVKVTALLVLCAYALLNPAGTEVHSFPEYQRAAFSSGVINGYLTMDTLAALVFSLIITKAINDRGITSSAKITKYTIIAGVIAGLGLTFIYISLFHLGAHSLLVSESASNGAQVLNAYVSHSFGRQGNIFLAFIITLACVVTAIGLTSACATYLHQITGWSYRIFVVVLAGASMAISNLGLNEIIHFSLPALSSIYPPFIVLVLYGAIATPNNRTHYHCLPTSLTALIFGILQSCMPEEYAPGFVKGLPLYSESLAWVTPTIAAFLVSNLTLKLFGSESRAVEASN